MVESFSTVVEVDALQAALDHHPQGGKVQVTVNERGELTLSPPPGETITLRKAS